MLAKDGVVGMALPVELYTPAPEQEVRLIRLPAQARCPYLGLNWDPTSTSMIASEEHRCFAVEGARIAFWKQDSLCLVPEYRDCETFALAVQRGLRPAAERAEEAHGWRLAIIALLPPVIAFALGFAAGLAFQR